MEGNYTDEEILKQSQQLKILNCNFHTKWNKRCFFIKIYFYFFIMISSNCPINSYLNLNYLLIKYMDFTPVNFLYLDLLLMKKFKTFCYIFQVLGNNFFQARCQEQQLRCWLLLNYGIGHKMLYKLYSYKFLAFSFQSYLTLKSM